MRPRDGERVMSQFGVTLTQKPGRFGGNCRILGAMRFNPSALVVPAVFYGLLWHAFKRGVDYGYTGALAAIVLTVAVAWLSVGVIAESPLGPRWPRRRKTVGVKAN